MQYLTYLMHVYGNVGGIYLNEKHVGDKVEAVMSVPAEKQKAAVKFLLDQISSMDWIDNKELMKEISLMGSPADLLRNEVMKAVIASPNKVELSALKAEKRLYCNRLFRRCLSICMETYLIRRKTIRESNKNAKSFCEICRNRRRNKNRERSQNKIFVRRRIHRYSRFLERVISNSPQLFLFMSSGCIQTCGKCFFESGCRIRTVIGNLLYCSPARWIILRLFA